ncbi:MAG: LapA family protein [Ferruginibacter sp.]
MPTLYIYLSISFAIGFLLAWILRSLTVLRMKKSINSLDGYLESEKLRKDTLLKENTGLHVIKNLAAENYEAQVAALVSIAKRQDEDILLLQKSNEETERLLEAGAPVVHSLKMQLIEAQNAIARYKAQTEKLSQVTP